MKILFILILSVFYITANAATANLKNTKKTSCFYNEIAVDIKGNDNILCIPNVTPEIKSVIIPVTTPEIYLLPNKYE